MKKNAWQMPISLLKTQKDLEKDNGHLLVLVLKKKWYCFSEDSPQGIWDTISERILVEFAESGCPVFSATSPLSRGQLKSNGHGKLSIQPAADLPREDPRERRKKENCGGRGKKKREILGPPTLLAPTFSGFGPLACTPP